MSDITIGEAIARRKLETSVYGSNTIYVQGQHFASRLGPNDCVLSWVDPSGGLCVVPCEQILGEWFHRGVMVYCTLSGSFPRVLPRAFALTGPMIQAIEVGMQRKATRRPAAPKPDDGS